MPKLHRLHVLISHAHADVGVVTALAKLLINSGLPQEDIYCTSLPSHGVHVGVDFERDIRKQDQKRQRNYRSSIRTILFKRLLHVRTRGCMGFRRAPESVSLPSAAYERV